MGRESNRKKVEDQIKKAIGDILVYDTDFKYLTKEKAVLTRSLSKIDDFDNEIVVYICYEIKESRLSIVLELGEVSKDSYESLYQDINEFNLSQYGEKFITFIDTHDSKVILSRKELCIDYEELAYRIIEGYLAFLHPENIKMLAPIFDAIESYTNNYGKNLA